MGILTESILVSSSVNDSGAIETQAPHPIHFFELTTIFLTPIKLILHSMVYDMEK